jgi:hypothetical protein
VNGAPQRLTRGPTTGAVSQDRGVAALKALRNAGLRRLDACAKDHYEDRSTALRQLVDFALRELRKQDALKAYRSGRVTLRDFARDTGWTPGRHTTYYAPKVSR